MCLYRSPSPHAQTKTCSPASVQSEGITVGMHHKKLALFRSEILLEYLTGCTQLTAHSSWGLQCHHHHSFYEPYGKMITLLSKHPLFHPADCLHTCSLIATARRRTIFHSGSGDPKDSRWELHCGAAAVSVLRRCQRPSCCLLLSPRRGFGTCLQKFGHLGPPGPRLHPAKIQEATASVLGFLSSSGSTAPAQDLPCASRCSGYACAVY